MLSVFVRWCSTTNQKSPVTFKVYQPIRIVRKSKQMFCLTFRSHILFQALDRFSMGMKEAKASTVDASALSNTSAFLAMLDPKKWPNWSWRTWLMKYFQGRNWTRPKKKTTHEQKAGCLHSNAQLTWKQTAGGSSKKANKQLTDKNQQKRAFENHNKSELKSKEQKNLTWNSNLTVSRKHNYSTKSGNIRI